MDADVSTIDLAHNKQMPSCLVVIGSGTGGPQALAEVLPRFPSTFPGTIIVVQQMQSGFTRVLANQLSKVCRLPIYEPIDGQVLRASEVLMVPGGTRCSVINLRNENSCIVTLEDILDDPERLENRTNDVMASAAKLFGRDSIGVLLTGMGNDGRDGMRSIVDAGGSTIAQDEDSSVIFDLPSSAINARVAHRVLPLWSIADHIISINAGEANANAA